MRSEEERIARLEASLERIEERMEKLFPADFRVACAHCGTMRDPKDMCEAYSRKGRRIGRGLYCAYAECFRFAPEPA